MEKQEEIELELTTLRSARKEFEKDFNDAMQSTRDKKKSRKPSASAAQPSRFHVWGRNSADTGLPTIPRVFNFAVSKIPNTADYSTEWFKDYQQKIFDRRDLQATIIDVQKIKSSFSGARTKTFKVLIKTVDMEVTVEKFFDYKMWVGGVYVSKYKRPRDMRLDPEAGSEAGLELQETE